MARQTCQNCGRRVGNCNLMPARDPWDGKMKWVCADADSCAAAAAGGLNEFGGMGLPAPGPLRKPGPATLAERADA